MSKIHYSIKSIIDSNIPFEIGRFKQHSPIDIYLKYYGLEIGAIDYRYGFVNCCEEKIFIQSFKPTNPRAIVLVLHGYFDHTGSMSNLINFLIKNNYHVISYDLQGHGLSSGKRAFIENFGQYGDVFMEVCETYIKPYTTLPKYLIAHSTGAAISVEYLLRSSSIFHHVILLAPLIRSYAWNLSKIGLSIMYPFVKELQRVFKVNSSNSEYLRFVKSDPLQHNKISVKWIKALSAWNEKIINYPKLEDSLLVIQGDRDKTVDWKYNLNFIRHKFPKSQIRIIKHGNHQLINESNRLVVSVLDCILEQFQQIDHAQSWD